MFYIFLGDGYGFGMVLLGEWGSGIKDLRPAGCGFGFGVDAVRNRPSPQPIILNMAPFSLRHAFTLSAMYMVHCRTVALSSGSLGMMGFSGHTSSAERHEGTRIQN